MNIFEKTCQFLGLSAEQRQNRADRVCLEQTTSGAEKFLDQGRIKSAVELYKAALIAIPHHGQFLHYNLACIMDRYVGDGAEARNHFMAAISMKTDAKIAPRESIESLIACCYENMMLLSLSYDEYSNWATKLHVVRPSEAILSGQWPVVKTRQDNGSLWWETLFGFADAYCNFLEPARDQKLYGKATSNYSLILDNMVNLRVPLQSYRTIGGLYSATLLGLCSQHLLAAEQRRINIESNEMGVVLEKAIPRLDNYLRTFPNETKVRECLEKLRSHLILQSN